LTLLTTFLAAIEYRWRPIAHIYRAARNTPTAEWLVDNYHGEQSLPAEVYKLLLNLPGRCRAYRLDSRSPGTNYCARPVKFGIDLELHLCRCGRISIGFFVSALRFQ
jgi:hypothetical protein